MENDSKRRIDIKISIYFESRYCFLPEIVINIYISILKYLSILKS